MKTSVKIVLIGSAAIAVAVGCYFIFKKPEKNAPPTGTTPITVAPQATSMAGFPLQVNVSNGALVTNLQNGLNQYVGVNIPITGTFDSATSYALNTLGFSIPVSQSDYNIIIAPPNTSNSVQVPNTNNSWGCIGVFCVSDLI